MIITMKQGDTYPTLVAYLQMGNGKPINLNGAAVKLKVKDFTGGFLLDKAVTVRNAATGLVEYEWEPEDTDTPGRYNMEFEVTRADGKIVSVPNDGYITLNIVDELGDAI